MNNASTPDGRGQDGPRDAEPFFPSEGTFNAVVPLSEIDQAHAVAPLPTVDPADVGKPAEAAWAREAHRARWKEEEEETLVPARAARARGGRPSWLAAASVIALSVAAGLASGTYLIWSSRRAPSAQTSARVAAEAPTLPPAPVTEQAEAVTQVEKAQATVKDEKPKEVSQAEQPGADAHAPKQATPLPPTPRAARVTRAAVEAKEMTPAPKPSRTQSAASPRPRSTTPAQQPPAPPISSPPPTAKSKKVIQWP